MSHFAQQRGQLALMERYDKFIERLEKSDKKEEKKEDSLAVKCAKDVQGNMGKIFGGVAQSVISQLATWSIILTGLYMLPGGRFVVDGLGKILGLHSFSTPPPAVTPSPAATHSNPGFFAHCGNFMVKGPAWILRGGKSSS